MLQEYQHRTGTHTHQDLGGGSVGPILFTVIHVEARHVEFLAVRILIVIRDVRKTARSRRPVKVHATNCEKVQEDMLRHHVESASSEYRTRRRCKAGYGYSHKNTRYFSHANCYELSVKVREAEGGEGGTGT